MKSRTLLFLAVIFVFLNCTEDNSVKSFEGRITYKVSVAPCNANAEYMEYQQQKYGDSVVLWIRSDGSFRRDYVNSGPKGFDFFIYDAVKNSGYCKWRSIDTIYSFDCATNSLVFIRDSILPSEELLNAKCSGYYISGIDPVGGQIVSLSYFYPTSKEYLDPQLYTNCKDFFIDKSALVMKAPYYKLIMDITYYTVSFEAASIETIAVPKDKCELPPNIPIK